METVWFYGVREVEFAMAGKAPVYAVEWLAHILADLEAKKRECLSSEMLFLGTQCSSPGSVLKMLSQTEVAAYGFSPITQKAEAGSSLSSSDKVSQEREGMMIK